MAEHFTMLFFSEILLIVLSRVWCRKQKPLQIFQVWRDLLHGFMCLENLERVEGIGSRPRLQEWFLEQCRTDLPADWLLRPLFGMIQLKTTMPWMPFRFRESNMAPVARVTAPQPPGSYRRKTNNEGAAEINKTSYFPDLTCRRKINKRNRKIALVGNWKMPTKSHWNVSNWWKPSGIPAVGNDCSGG